MRMEILSRSTFPDGQYWRAVRQVVILGDSAMQQKHAGAMVYGDSVNTAG